MLRPDMDTPFEQLVRRTAGLQPWRRVVHAVVGLGLAGIIWLEILPSPVLAAILGLIVTVAVVTDVLRLLWPAFNHGFFRTFRHLISPREATSPASSTWYVISVCVVMALFPSRVWVPSILVVALADPCAHVSGRLWGRGEPGEPSLVGSGVFWLVATLCLLPFGGVGSAALVALVVTTVEGSPLPLDDNLTVPLATAAALAVAG